MREKIDMIGFENLSDHEQLECFLYAVIPQKNTNEMAHALIQRFGSLNNVFNETIEHLKEVPGVGNNVARFIKDIPLISSAYLSIVAKGVKSIKAPIDILKNFQPMMQVHGNEHLFVLCLDNAGKVLYANMLNKGTTDEVAFNPHDLINFVSFHKASNVVIMHNHPNGEAQPSLEDIESTRKIYFALNSINVCLLDHYIFNHHGEAYSFLNDGWFEKYNKSFNSQAPFSAITSKMSAFKRMDKIKKD